MIEKFPISRSDEWYRAWPDVGLGANDRLLCVFAECDKHAAWREVTQIMLCISDDRGRTWTKARPLTSRTSGGDTGYWNCPRITRLRDGRLVVVVDRLFSQECSASPEDCRNYLLFSEDNGETWTEPQETPALGIVPDRIVELPTGRWTLGTHYLDHDFGQLIQRTWLSDDQGASWHGPYIIGKVKGLNLCEVSILPVEENTLVAFMRENSGQAFDCYRSISRDNGVTWSQPDRFPLPGCHCPTTGFLQNGQILITYRFLQGGCKLRYQQTHAALTDSASTLAETRNAAWARILPLDYDRALHPDTGYTGWVQFDDGEIYVVNYIRDDSPDRAQIRGYSLTMQVFVLE